MTFEWDPIKAEKNLRKHRIAFGDATIVFLDPLAITFTDPHHSAEESREITIGYKTTKRLVLVSQSERASDSYYRRAFCNTCGAKTV